MNLLIPPPLVVAITGTAMWKASRTIEFGQFSFVFQEPLAIALLVLGLLLMAVSIASFVTAGTTVNPLKPANASNLVTSGIFKLSRNPIYLGDLLVLATLALWLGNLVNIALLVLFVWYIERFQILPEERALAALFGAQYAAYCAKVRRWL